MKKILQRVLDSAVAVVMIGLSLIFQAFFFLLLGFGILGLAEVAGHKFDSDSALFAVLFYALIVGLFLLFNGLTCYIYFKHRRANVGLDSDASVFFYIPRGIDTIVFGSQRVSRSRGVSDINPQGTSAQPTDEHDGEDTSP